MEGHCRLDLCFNCNEKRAQSQLHVSVSVLVGLGGGQQNIETLMGGVLTFKHKKISIYHNFMGGAPVRVATIGRMLDGSGGWGTSANSSICGGGRVDESRGALEQNDDGATVDGQLAT
jgi:hypothetical protein